MSINIVLMLTTVMYGSIGEIPIFLAQVLKKGNYLAMLKNPFSSAFACIRQIRVTIYLRLAYGIF